MPLTKIYETQTRVYFDSSLWIPADIYKHQGGDIRDSKPKRKDWRRGADNRDRRAKQQYSTFISAVRRFNGNNSRFWNHER